MADYESWSLWDIDDPDNIDPETLPLSDDLKKGLADWEAAYDATLNRSDPASSGFESEAAARKFSETGWALFDQLREELPNVDLVYFDNFTNSIQTGRQSA